MVENSNSGLLLKDILSDLSFERELEIIAFEDENSLINHLINAHENILDGQVHNTKLFNLSPPLKNNHDH